MTAGIQIRRPAPLDAAADQVMVAMRDGTRLATDVYLPPGAPAQPAVLVRLPYDKCGRYTFMPAVAPLMLERGYAFVVQDVRGKFRSEGETVPYVHEVADGYDTIEWITQQPWCNGIVGMFGDSYYGWTQWAAVASGHRALRAIVPRVTSADLGTIRVQTRWDRGVVPLYGASYFARHWTTNDDYELDIDWSVRPLSDVFEGLFDHAGARAAGFDAMLGRHDGWVPFPDGHPFERREVPALHTVGWFDNIGPDSMRDYMTLQGHGRTLQYLIADAIDHENYHLADTPISFTTDHDANDDALTRLLPKYLGPALDFFDVFLKGAGEPPPRARWRAGHGDWRSAERWPAPGTIPMRLYLDDADRGPTSVNGGGLRERRPAVRSVASWIHEPDDLVPSTVANPFALLYESPDETTVHARGDVATFTAEPVERPLELAGPVRARLVLSGSDAATQVYAKLSEVSTSGRALMLARGQAHVDFAGDDTAVSVYMGHVAHVLRPGHRLRLHVATSDFPLYMPLFGDGGSPWTATTTRASGQRLRAGGELASFIEFDVLPGVGG
jgi:putative CocE/NonD family hydrolase